MISISSLFETEVISESEFFKNSRKYFLLKKKQESAKSEKEKQFKIKRAKDRDRKRVNLALALQQDKK